ncbi:MAG TPA: response regulator transcription factor [Rhizobacter sp.]|nr:response regulator transcription factor [Rhizobacter sp.]
MPSVVLLQRDHEASPRLRSLIDATPRFHVVGELHTTAQARRLMQHNPPDVLVTDLRVQDGSVYPFLQELRQGARVPSPHVLVTLLSRDDVVLLEALRGGADGYWIHACEPNALIGALEQVARGESPMTPTIARQVLAHFQHPALPVCDTMTEAFNSLVLTRSEEQVLHWVAQGYLVDEIAQQWRASVHSVGREIRRVYQKLRFDLQATALSLQQQAA